jgi:mono/diheme cytochrome c family protein
MFNLILRILLVVVALVALVAAGAGIYVARTWDRVYDAPMPEVHASTDPEVIARGEYLVYGPAHCVACHGPSLSAIEQLSEGIRPPLSGGNEFPLGPLGIMYAKNLTPDPETGIGRYTDGEIARLMRYNVRPNGRTTVDPMMPFGNMSDEDVTAVISFLRAQPPVRNEVPDNQWTLMGKAVKSFTAIFKPRTAVAPPAVSPESAPTPERGEYLARSVGNCVGCHTPRDEMTFAAIGPEFSGGMAMEPERLPGADPAVWFISPNITPAPTSAFMKFPDRETFVARFKAGGRQHRGTPMPWEAFANMSDDDIASVYEFLRTLPPLDGPTGDPTFRP